MIFSAVDDDQSGSEVFITQRPTTSREKPHSTRSDDAPLAAKICGTVCITLATDIVANSSFNSATRYFRYAEIVQKIKLKIKLWPSIHSRAMLVNLRN